MTLTQGSRIFADTIDTDPGGEVLVHTRKAVTLTEGSRIKADILSTATVTGGDVTIETGQLSIQGDGSFIRARRLGKTGQGGDLTVTATDFVELIDADGGLFAQTLGAKNAGTLTIDTRRLSVRDGARVFTGTRGEEREEIYL